MTLQDLEQEYKRLQKDDIPGQVKFVMKLTASNADDIMEFHYSLLKNKENEWLYQSIRTAFKKRKKKGIIFLLNKLQNENDTELIADTLQLLGNLRCEEVLPFLYKYIKHSNTDLRYRSIIALGWLGNEEDISLLAEKLTGDKDPSIRGYAATAMRQVWYRIPETANQIIKIFKDALISEKHNKALSLILLCVQEIAGVRLGIKEDVASLKYTKNLSLLKQKALNFLEKQ